jgi:hypothetical protein
VGLTLKLLEIIVGYYSRDMEDPIVEVIWFYKYSKPTIFISSHFLVSSSIKN